MNDTGIPFEKLRRPRNLTGKVLEFFTEEQLIQLAKENKITHYVISNSITGENTIVFLQQDINEWFSNYCIKKEDAIFNPIQFRYFNKDRFLAGKQEIPDELRSIERVYKLPVDCEVDMTGVYFLCKNKQIKYVGQSRNIFSRIGSHILEKIKDFDSVYFIRVPRESLNEIERKCIWYFKPEYNKTSFNGSIEVSELMYEIERVTQ